VELERFLREPRKPMILALSRPDERKNISTLVHAYGEHRALQETANLVLVAGNRDDIQGMEKGPRNVLSEILLLIDRYDLYGRAAYPKHHHADDVPILYRLAAKSGGVFINPALTEPFGLTLIEAAASGLPIIATEDGGPRDIVGHCKNGVLIDPLNASQMGQVLYDAVTNRTQWRRWSKNGVLGAHRHFSWGGHVRKYLQEVDKVRKKSQRKRTSASTKSKLPTLDRLLVSDIDNTLIGDWDALQALLEKLRNTNGQVGFGIATGRRLESAAKVLKEWKVPPPDVLVTAVGTEIYYRDTLEPDPGYQLHLDYRWEPQAVRDAMQELPGIRMQGTSEQRRYKISYFMDPEKAPGVRQIIGRLRQRHLHANVVFSHGMYLDVLPVRASKGSAIRYLADKWGIPVDSILVAGDSGNDEEMLSGNTLGVVVGNHSAELERLRDRERIYFADGHYAWGILEGIEYYDFFGSIRTTYKQSNVNE